MSQEPTEERFDDITIFTTEDGATRVEVRFQQENVWLTQKLMAELYECSTDNVGLHLKKIFAERELDPAATTEESSVVQNEGGREVTRKVIFYSLEAIIAVGTPCLTPLAFFVEISLMDWVTVLWSALAGVCLMLALMHLVVWCKNRHLRVNLWFSLTVLDVFGLVRTVLKWMRVIGVRSLEKSRIH